MTSFGKLTKRFFSRIGSQLKKLVKKPRREVKIALSGHAQEVTKVSEDRDFNVVAELVEFSDVNDQSSINEFSNHSSVPEVIEATMNPQSDPNRNNQFIPWMLVSSGSSIGFTGLFKSKSLSVLSSFSRSVCLFGIEKNNAENYSEEEQKECAPDSLRFLILQHLKEHPINHKFFERLDKEVQEKRFGCRRSLSWTHLCMEDYEKLDSKMPWVFNSPFVSF